MSLTRAKTGPGGTEFLVHPGNSAIKEASRAEPAVALQTHTSRRRPRQDLGHVSQLPPPAGAAFAEGLHPKLELALRERQQFWIDTCRDARDMRYPTQRSMELHRHHGCRFCVPTAKQVQYILDALDSALPHWDRDHPELFFSTLELNFPELLRHSPAHRKF